MRTRIHQIVIGLTLAFSIGLHWPILQSVAWMNMLVTFAQEDGFEQAVVKTFGGENPCDMCLFVAEGKKASQEIPQELSLKKIDLAPAEKAIVFVPRPSAFEPTPFSLSAEVRLYPPRTPPPDLA